MNANDILHGRMILDNARYYLAEMYLGETKVWPLDEPDPGPTSPPVYTAEQTTAGDVLYVDSNGHLLFSNGELETAQYAYDLGYTPIGVVVVPGTHNVYGDGSCGVMSLKEMNCDTPDTGSTLYQNISWGHYPININELTDLTQAPTGNTEDGIPTGQTAVPNLPSDKFNSYQCLHDTDAYYSTSSNQAPSPYLTDGSRNPGYYQTTSPSSTNNCLADFDGMGNSIILWDKATAQSNWRTASTITNNSGDNYLPAACCCWRYHTEGTQQGDWYLPAMGELGYIMPPFNRINEAIDNMRNAYGTSVGVEVNTGGWYWSSNESSSYNARYLNAYNGGVGGSPKSTNYYVRAFLRVNNSGVVSSTPPA